LYIEPYIEPVLTQTFPEAVTTGLQTVGIASTPWLFKKTTEVDVHRQNLVV